MQKCKDHPKYKGINRPRVNCFSCIQIYNNNHINAV